MVHYADIVEPEHQTEEAGLHESRQAALVELSQCALIEQQLQPLFQKTVTLVSKSLSCEFSKILELLPEGKHFLLRAGMGWKEGSVGHALVSADLNSQAGYTLLSSKPTRVGDNHYT